MLQSKDTTEVEVKIKVIEVSNLPKGVQRLVIYLDDVPYGVSIYIKQNKSFEYLFNYNDKHSEDGVFTYLEQEEILKNELAAKIKKITNVPTPTEVIVDEIVTKMNMSEFIEGIDLVNSNEVKNKRLGCVILGLTNTEYPVG